MRTLCEDLSPILEAELQLGNYVVDQGVAWGQPDGIMVLLGKPFQFGADKLPACVTLTEVNDPHYWKSEYRCLTHHDVLACRF